MADEYKQLLRDIKEKRLKKEKLEALQYHQKLGLFNLSSAERKLINKEIAVSTSLGVLPSGRKTDDIKRKKTDLQAEYKKTVTDLSTVRDEYNRLIDTLFQKFPVEKLTEGKTDTLPVLLFPVKIEAKFHDKAGAPRELWVRIYPDDIGITTHEDKLTTSEVSEGKTYWKKIWQAEDNEDDKKDAWMTLVKKHGAPRSAWIAHATKPTNFDTLPAGSSPESLIFPSYDNTKPDSWTLAPKSKIMPDRFVVIGVNGDKKVILATGKQIPDPLICGPDPLDAENAFDQKDGNINLGSDFNWLVDFEKAIDVGMGIKVVLEEPYSSKGFEKIFVLGLKWSMSEDDSKNVVENLIHEHHYSPGGFSMVKLGTPTNNTDDDGSGYSENDVFNSLSYYIEQDGALFNREIEFYEITDGQRLADLLGIDILPLQNIQNADQLEFAEAVAMNRALYQATLGYYLDTMMEPVFTDEQTKLLRKLLTDSVTGRGMISAIRVGNQPYGILPASDFSKWKFDPEKEVFHYKLHQVMTYFNNEWKKLLPIVSYIGKRGNPSQMLLDILGLHPDSVAFYQRVGYSADYLRNLDDFKSGGKYFGDMLRNEFEKLGVMQIFNQLGYDPASDDMKPKKTPHFLQIIYKHYHTTIDNKNLIDGNPLSEINGIQPYHEEENYIHWLVKTNKLEDLEKQNFGDGIVPPNYLLYMLLRHSLFLQLYESTGNFYGKNNVTLNRYKRAIDFYNIKTQQEPTKWELMKADASLQQGANKNISVADQLMTDFAVNPSPEENHLKEVKEALSFLAGLSTAKLERAFVEHIDCLTYRLDAWQTALFSQRLLKQRGLLGSQPSEPNSKLYFGAFGWLENVVPATVSKQTIPDPELPEKLRNNDNSVVYDDPQNGGYVHTPSLNHAYASTLLRNAYLTHAGSSEGELMTINISSSRVRNAIDIIQGVRNGQNLEVLLGYQFERAMHDRTTENPSLMLNAYITDFRIAFPLKKQPVPQKGSESAEDATEEYSVVNGLTLSETDKDFPFSIAALSGVSTDVRDAILAIQDQLRNSLDAVKDILTSESTYQLALGNFDRAGAGLKSISDSTIPAEVESIRSQRGNEITFTNRVIVQFEAEVDPSVSGNNPWNIVPLSPQVLMEPGLNKWLAGILGDPSKILCTIHHVVDETTTSVEQEYSLSSFKIQPVEFINLIGNEQSAAASALEQIIARKYRLDVGIGDDVLVKISFSTKISTGADTFTFAEIFPLAVKLRQLISGSRPVNAEDMQSSSKDKPVDASNPKGFDIPALQTKITTVKAAFDTAKTTFESAKSDFELAPNPARANTLREALYRVSHFGIANALPVSHTGLDDKIKAALLQQAGSIKKKLDEISLLYTEKNNAANAETDSTLKINLLVAAVKLILGESFMVMPVFNLNNPADIQSSYNDRDTILKHSKDILKISMPVENWIHSVTKVRPGTALLEDIRLLSDALDRNEIKMEAIQIPYKANDNWLAAELPPLAPGEERGILHDPISLIFSPPLNFDPNTRQCGLLVDEWNEVIPEEKSVTGIAMHFNQPGAESPQVLLLAITPEETGSWKWNNLIGILDDTLLRAKLRMIEPDLTDTTTAGVILPALISEFSTTNSNISLDYSMAITKVYEEVKLKFAEYGI